MKLDKVVGSILAVIGVAFLFSAGTNIAVGVIATIASVYVLSSRD